MRSGCGLVQWQKHKGTRLVLFMTCFLLCEANCNADSCGGSICKSFPSLSPICLQTSILYPLMAINLLTVVVVCVISHCLISQISIVEAKNIEVSFQLNASSVDCFRLSGDAFFTHGNHIVQLTDSSNGLEGSHGSAGRAAYKRTLIPLWNASTNAVANFSTHIQFQINWTNQSTERYTDYGGDGLAFFMAPLDSGYHVAYRADGGYLGLFDGSPSNQVIAVEFDTYSNRWDPDDSHVGIDVNDVNSAKTVSLNQRLNDGKVWDAQIDYYGHENMLNASVSCSSNGQGPTYLSHEINLTKYLPENVVVGVSAAALKSSEVHQLISWSFTSVISEPPEESTTLSPPPRQISTPPSNRKISSKLVIIIISVCCLVTVISVCFLIHCNTRRKRRASEEHSDMDVVEHSDMDGVLDHVPRKFTYAELSAGTNHFSENEKLGHGGFGDVYKCILINSGEIVAVKRISAGSKQGKKEYLAEITTITRLRHRNLVQLLGWCHEKAQLLLVYEYLPNGSLDKLLFGERKGALDWTRRYKIASDIASALLYLHELWDECVVHRDIKSSNIMLDSEFNAKLGDFGLARMVKHDQWIQTSTIAGTLGYLAPECAVTGISSAESDVFSFGAVALEIACGRCALDLRLEKSKMRLVEWIWNLYGQGRLFDAADSSLNEEFDRAEMEQLIVIGLWCSHPDPFTRPKIRQVLQLLNFEVPMPLLPRTLPIAAYSPLPQGPFIDSASASSYPPAPGTSSKEMVVLSTSAVSSDLPSTSSDRVSTSTN